MQVEGFLNSIVQTQEHPALGPELQSVDGKQQAAEFSALLSEAKELSKENIEPEVLMASLEEEGQNLTKEQKNILQSVVLGNSINKSNESELSPQLNKVLGNVDGSIESAELETEEVPFNVKSQDSNKTKTALNNLINNAESNLTDHTNEVSHAKNFFPQVTNKEEATEFKNMMQPKKSLAETAELKKMMQSNKSLAETNKQANPALLNNLYVKMTARTPNAKPSFHDVNEIINTNDNQSESELFLQNLKQGSKSVSKGMNNYLKGQEVLDNTIIKNNRSDFFNTSHNLKTGELSTEMSKTAASLFDESMAEEGAVTKAPATEFSNIQLNGLSTGVQKTNQTQQIQQTNNTQVFDMSNVDSSNAAEVIDKISNYVSQSRLQNTEELNLVVKDNALGKFNINVNKLKNQGNVQLEITTMADEGHKFFTENESDLVKSLIKSGIKLTDVKVTASGENQQTNNDSRNSSGKNSSEGQSQQFGSKDRNEDADSQRRQSLWEQYKERVGA